IANNSGSYASAIYGLSNLLTGSSVNTSGTATSKSWLASQKNNSNAMSTLINNTISANNVKNESDLTIYIEGTDLSGSRTIENSQEHGQKMADLAAETFGDEGNGEYFYWNGGNTQEDRAEATYDLLNLVNNYDFKEDEPLNLVAHSHGGNVVKEFTNLYDLAREVMTISSTTNVDIGNQSYSNDAVNYKQVDKVLLEGTPHRDDHTFNFNVMASNGTVYNFYDTGDWLVQDMAGGINTPLKTLEIPFTEVEFTFPVPNTFYNSSQTTSNVINIPITQSREYSTGDFIKNNLINKFTPKRLTYEFEGGVGAYDSHVGLNTPETWKNYISPAIENINNN
ncbi:hypothetical protein ACFL0U_03915, partial [Pseudomonadota bacterium]